VSCRVRRVLVRFVDYRYGTVRYGTSNVPVPGYQVLCVLFGLHTHGLMMDEILILSFYENIDLKEHQEIQQ
jgi:hypothetical protein